MGSLKPMRLKFARLQAQTGCPPSRPGMVWQQLFEDRDKVKRPRVGTDRERMTHAGEAVGVSDPGTGTRGVRGHCPVGAVRDAWSPTTLVYPVNYTIWIPKGVKTLRGVIVHQH